MRPPYLLVLTEIDAILPVPIVYPSSYHLSLLKFNLGLLKFHFITPPDPNKTEGDCVSNMTACKKTAEKKEKQTNKLHAKTSII